MADQITITSPTPQEDPAHVAAMVAKVDGQQAPAGAPQENQQDQQPERPSWLPEKFASVEDMAKAYAELEAKQSGQQEPEKKPESDPQGDQPGADDAAKALADKGLNLDDFSNEFSQTGTLSAESYEKLEKAGYPKTIVDQYIAGQQAIAANYEADIKSAAGGAEKWDQVAEWAAANLTDVEKTAFNAAIDSRNPEQAKLAVAGLAAKFDAANPTEGNLIAGRFSNAVADRYESLAQVTADMAKPEYKADPAFRKKVQDKIARSDVL